MNDNEEHKFELYIPKNDIEFDELVEFVLQKLELKQAIPANKLKSLLEKISWFAPRTIHPKETALRKELKINIGKTIEYFISNKNKPIRDYNWKDNLNKHKRPQKPIQLITDDIDELTISYSTFQPASLSELINLIGNKWFKIKLENDYNFEIEHRTELLKIASNYLKNKTTFLNHTYKATVIVGRFLKNTLDEGNLKQYHTNSEIYDALKHHKF